MTSASDVWAAGTRLAVSARGFGTGGSARGGGPGDFGRRGGGGRGGALTGRGAGGVPHSQAERRERWNEGPWDASCVRSGIDEVVRRPRTGERHADAVARISNLRDRCREALPPRRRNQKRRVKQRWAGGAFRCVAAPPDIAGDSRQDAIGILRRLGNGTGRLPRDIASRFFRGKKGRA